MHKISPSSAFIGQNRVFIETVSSTNEIAKEINRENDLDNGFLIWSAYQQAGRGRDDRTWFGDAGKNLLASFVLKPFQLRSDHLPMLNFACTLAALETVQTFLPQSEVKIKWPNDIMANDKKIAGILIENQINAGMVTSCIFGIGINVNQPTFPNSLPHATSILKQTGTEIRIEDVLEHICHRLEERMDQLQQMNYTLLHSQVNHLLYGKNQEVEFSQGTARSKGVIEGISTNGELEIRQGETIYRHLQGDIKLNVYGVNS